MKILILISAFFLFCTHARAQQQSFEGVVVYETKVSSKLDEVSADGWKRLLLWGDSVTVYFKNGFYKEVFPGGEVYSNPEKQKTYYHYKGIDSLFYTDYHSDSIEVSELLKYNTVSYINNVRCNKLELKTSQYTTTYEYAPSMHLDPVYDTGNTSGRYDMYIKEAASVYLKMTKDVSAYSYTKTANRIAPTALPDSLFALPNLPITKYSFSSIGTFPQFRGGLDGYRQFLEKHLNGNLAAKYVPIPKGQKMGSTKVRLRFVVTEKGKVVDVQAVNRNEVHPLLADDAERVMRKVPSLTPATLNGQTIPFVYLASVTYATE